MRVQRNRVVGAVVVVVLLIAAGVVWKLRKSSEAATGPIAAVGASGAKGTRDATSSKQAPAVPASVSGRVTRKTDGAGVAGAQVSLSRLGLGAMFDEEKIPTIVVVSDAQGAWTAPSVGPGTYAVAATARGFSAGIIDKLVIASGEKRTGVDLALDSGGMVVSGTVSDVLGGPIAGARITVEEDGKMKFGMPKLIAIADESGRYEIMLGEGSYSADATHDDYTEGERNFEVAGTPITIDFTLTPGATIRGVVVTTDGTPVPGASVGASGGRGNFSTPDTTADEAGAFVIKGLGAGTKSLSALARGYATETPTVVELGIGEQLDGVRVVVSRAFTISGIVVKKGTTTPIPGVRLGVFSFSGQAVLGPDPTDAEGRFEIYGVKPASFMLFAISEDVMPEIGQQVEVVDKDVSDVKIEMAVGVTVSGRVEPAAVASIGIAPTNVGIGNIFEAIKSMIVRADSDETGAFTLKNVPAGTFTLNASTTDGRAAKQPLLVADRDITGVVIKLEPRASIAGRVVDTSGKPVVGVRVTASPPRDKDSASGAFSFNMDGMRNAGTSTAGDGSFRIKGLDAGTFNVRVVDDQGQLAWGDSAHKDKPREPIKVELAAAAERTGLTLTVEGTDGTIKGVVLGPDKKPASDVWISTTLEREEAKDGKDKGDFDQEAAMARYAMGSSRPPTLTNADGAFTVSRLRRGTYTLTATSAKGNMRIEKKGVKTGDTVTLTLASLGTLTGRVTSGGSPVAKYEIDCTKTGDYESVDRQISDANGAYSLERMIPGDYKCVATSDQGQALSKVTVPAGEAKLDLVMVPWASITGTVVSVLSGEPVVGVKILAGSKDSFDSSQFTDMLGGKGPTSDAAGRFVVPRVSPGKGELAVMPKAGGFEQLAKREYEITAGQKLDLGTIKIVPPREGDAGTLGMSTDLTEGVLTVASVKAGGPAEASGVQVGDKITSVNGIPVATLTPEIAKTLMSSGVVGVGQTFLLGLERAGAPVQVSVVAVKW